MCVAAAIGGAIVGSSIIGAGAQKSAANTQASADQQAANTQAQIFNTLKQQQQPFIQSGYKAQTSLNNLMGLGTSAAGAVDPSTGLPTGYLTQIFNPTQEQLDNYPGYQFALKTGGQAVQNANTPTQGALSGATVKDLMGFNQGLANTNYGNYFNQFQTQQSNIYNRLSSIAGLGQNAAANVGNSGTQLGTGIAGAQAAAGAARAGGTLGAADSLSGSSVPLAYLLSQGTGGSSALNSALTNTPAVGNYDPTSGFLSFNNDFTGTLPEISIAGG